MPVCILLCQLAAQTELWIGMAGKQAARHQVKVVSVAELSEDEGIEAAADVGGSNQLARWRRISEAATKQSLRCAFGLCSSGSGHAGKMVQSKVACSPRTAPPLLLLLCTDQ